MSLEPFIYYFMMTLWWPRHTNEHISTDIHTYKYIKEPMRQWYPYSTKWEENIVVILHVYVSRAIFLLFYYDQDTGSVEKLLGNKKI